MKSGVIENATLVVVRSSLYFKTLKNCLHHKLKWGLVLLHVILKSRKLFLQVNLRCLDFSCDRCLDFSNRFLKFSDCDVLSHAALANKILFKLLIRLVKVIIDLLQKSRPLFTFLLRAYCFLSYHNKFREPISISKIRIWHDWLSFNYHVNLDLKLLCRHLRHTVFVTFIDDGYDEIHEDHVAHDHNHKPNKPCEWFAAVFCF